MNEAKKINVNRKKREREKKGPFFLPTPALEIYTPRMIHIIQR
jgi:hypothetical protein